MSQIERIHSSENIRPMGQVWKWPKSSIVMDAVGAASQMNQLAEEGLMGNLNYQAVIGRDYDTLNSVLHPFEQLVRAQYAFIQAFYQPPNSRIQIAENGDYGSSVDEERRMYSIFEGFDAAILAERLQRSMRSRYGNADWIREDTEYSIRISMENIDSYLQRSRRIFGLDIPPIELGPKLNHLNYCPFYDEALRGEFENPIITKDVDLIVDTRADNRKVHIVDHALGREYFLASTGGLGSLCNILRRYDIELRATSITKATHIPSQPQSVVFDVDGVLRDGYNLTHSVRSKLFKRLNKRHVPYGIWTRNGGTFGDRMATTHAELQTKGGDYQPSFEINFDNWPFVIGDRLLLSSFAPSLQEIVESLTMFLADSRHARSSRQEIILETKSPRILATLPEYAAFSSELEDGVLVDDRESAIVSAVLFGHNFIHLDDIKNLPDVAHLIGV